MNGMPTLTTALLDLLKEIEGANVPLIVGGGYGIYLRYMRIVEERRRTMFDALPDPRSTNDLDLFLRAELLLDSARLKPLKDALNRLNYEVIEGAEHYQFVRPGPGGDKERGIKIDVLTGPTKPFEGTRVRFDKRRVRPNPSVHLHAHPCEEALTLTEGASQREISGTLSLGAAYRGTVLLPHPFTFLTMKLFALRDRINDATKDYGRHHALDLYMVVGSMSPDEWDECLAMRNAHKDETVLTECGRIISEQLAGMDTLGTLRLRESTYFRPDFNVTGFLSALNELFPTNEYSI